MQTKLHALTRTPAPSIANCELTHLQREPIDYAKAVAQHQLYCQALTNLGIKVTTLFHNDFADGVFVEDPAIVLDEVALITRPGAASRMDEVPTLATELARFREVKQMTPPATLEGGDVLCIGKKIFIGHSSRTNQSGIEQLKQIAKPLGYEINVGDVQHCLHLKTGCSYIGDDTILINPQWIDRDLFHNFQILEIDPSEPFAANAIFANDQILYSTSFPRTLERMEGLGFEANTVDNSELLKAESGLSCMSLIFKS